MGRFQVFSCINRLTQTDQVHEAVHAVADLEEDVAALPDCLRAERRPEQPGDAGHQEERAQKNCNDLHLLHQGDGDGLPLKTEERQHITTTYTVTGFFLGLLFSTRLPDCLL